MTIPQDIYRVKIRFRDRVHGATPNNPSMVEGMLRARARKWLEDIEKGKAEPPPEGSVEEVTLARIAETLTQVELDEETGWSVFKKDDTGYYLEPRCIKAMQREAAFGLGLNRRPPLGCKQDVREYCWIKPVGWQPGQPERIYFQREDGSVVNDVDGIEERPIHVEVQGKPQNTISRNDYLEQVYLDFDVCYLATRNSRPDEAEFRDMMELAQELGLGATRSQCYGKFDLLEIEVIKKHPIHRGKGGDEEGGESKPKKAVRKGVKIERTE